MVKEDSCLFFNFGSLTFFFNVPFTLNLFEI